MGKAIYRKIIELVTKATDLARTVNINNLLQPGLVKEMIIADILGHTLITSKRDADAHAPNDPTILYEYLSCKEGGSGQFDRMFKHPPDKRVESLNRIWRNHKVYFAVFYAKNQIKVKVIYELEPMAVVEEAERQLDNSRNNISHVGLSERKKTERLSTGTPVLKLCKAHPNEVMILFPIPSPFQNWPEPFNGVGMGAYINITVVAINSFRVV